MKIVREAVWLLFFGILWPLVATGFFVQRCLGRLLNALFAFVSIAIFIGCVLIFLDPWRLADRQLWTIGALLVWLAYGLLLNFFTNKVEEELDGLYD